MCHKCLAICKLNQKIFGKKATKNDGKYVNMQISVAMTMIDDDEIKIEI